MTRMQKGLLNISDGFTDSPTYESWITRSPRMAEGGRRSLNRAKVAEALEKSGTGQSSPASFSRLATIPEVWRSGSLNSTLIDRQN